MNIPNVLVPAIVGLICGILGYLLGRMNSKKDDSLASSLQADLDASKANTKNLTTRISALEAELSYKEINNSIQSPVTEEPIQAFDSSVAANVLNKNIQENDLKIIEGVGPIIENLLNDAGIKSWYDLSVTSTEDLQAILDARGENDGINNPSTWAKQASYAYEGKWLELNEWQENLRSGKE
ncbi:MAG: hypothetical protein EOO44_10705 [Flavobacterium sp.]|nr:MAG: hypothetical protein EOO44_10705 [Flavobacterium sp.]